MAAYMYSGAPETKIDGVRRLGGEVRFISMETWWDYIVGASRPDGAELLVKPVTDQAVLGACPRGRDLDASPTLSAARRTA